MMFACPEIHQRSDSRCGNINGAGSSAAFESLPDGAALCGEGASCARKRGAAQRAMQSIAQVANENARAERIIPYFSIPFR